MWWLTFLFQGKKMDSALLTQVLKEIEIKHSKFASIFHMIAKTWLQSGFQTAVWQNTCLYWKSIKLMCVCVAAECFQRTKKPRKYETGSLAARSHFNYLSYPKNGFPLKLGKFNFFANICDPTIISNVDPP